MSFSSRRSALRTAAINQLEQDKIPATMRMVRVWSDVPDEQLAVRTVPLATTWIAKPSDYAAHGLIALT